MLVQINAKEFCGNSLEFSFLGMIVKSQDFLEKFRTELGATENESPH